MINPSIFKAYDIRGKYPQEINDDAVAEISLVLGKYFKKGKIVVGRDARLSSPQLHEALLTGLKAANKKLEIIDAGMITTPMLYFLANKLKSVGGIMVTASHNPKEYNGLKVVGQKAKAMNGQEIYELCKKLR